MNRFLTLLAAAVVSLTPGTRVSAQETSHAAELRFVRDLRARHYTDLALEYLERLRKKNPSPELLKELPLELAETRLDAAADEPDSGKRLAVFEQARGEIEAFLRDNPNHSRTGEAKLEIGRVVVLQGKTQLSRALARDNLEARIAEGDKARKQFVDASALLKNAADQIEAQLAKIPDPGSDADKAQRKKLENDRLQARLAVALNALDQGETYFDLGKLQVLEVRGKKIQEAVKLLEKLAAQDENNPACWEASAWLGWCLFENGDPPKARAKLSEVINSALPAAIDGRRLARYFRLSIQFARPSDDEEKDPKFLATLIADANGWLVSYPSYARTPEGYGLRYLLAEFLRRRATDPKTPPLQKDGDLARARRLLKEVEQTENDFTDRARRLKVSIIAAQSGFKVPVAQLPTFEDCYVRAQYEIISMDEDAKPAKDGNKPDPKKLEEMQKARTETAIAALRRGLTLPDAKPVKGKATPEVNNARAMLAFYNLNQQHYKEAIDVGEGFARDDPRSGQAATAAVYALQAYAQLIARRERDNALPEELRPDREKMLAFDRYVEQRWPRELAGDVARHQIALGLLREQKQAKEAADQTRLLNDAAAELGAISKDYPSYVLAQYQLADACLQADRDNLEPAAGQKPGDYRRRAIAVLTALPEPKADAEPVVGQVYVLGKGKLAWELYKDKQFDAMLKLGDDLAAKLPVLPMEEAVREQMLASVTDVRLFASGSLAEADFIKARYAEVAAKLDPLAASFTTPDANPANKLVAAEMKKNLQLGSTLLNMDLRANVQLGRLEKVEPIIKAIQSLTAEGDAPGGAAKILQTLVYVIKQQIDELDKKGDQANKEKAVAGFTKLLDKVVDKPDKLEMQPRLLLAQCYANMNQHAKAAALLEKVATPAEKSAQFLYARELRLAKDLEKARQVVGEILGTAKAPGWGARNVDALIEEVALTEDEGNFDKAALKANDIVRRLLPNITRDNALKEKYFEAYYHVVYAFVKYAQSLSDPAMKEKSLRQAAFQAIELDKKWPNYGGEASAKRFNELFAAEPEFKELVERLKANDK
jgi:outer membrane protein assembly factor BamD (BamD/ComL family)